MAKLAADELRRKALELEWVLTDVDGVLTDGGLYYDRRGHQLTRFNVKDGMGLKLAQVAGLKVGVLSARSSPALDKRTAELKLDVSMTGAFDKGARFEAFLKQESTKARKVCFIGDDLTDLVVLGRCALSFAPADAVAEVKTVVDRVLTAEGGRGAVREAVEVILKARGDWDRVLARFSFEA